MEAQTDAVSERYLGGESAVKKALALSKILWTAFGFSQMTFVVVALITRADPVIDFSKILDVQGYTSRGGVFTQFPFIAALLFLLSLRYPRMAFRALRVTPGHDASKPDPRKYFAISLFQSVFAEIVSFLGLVLCLIARQPTFLAPFLVAGLAAWLNAYPTRERMDYGFFSAED